jgi:hypothetical protein
VIPCISLNEFEREKESDKKIRLQRNMKPFILIEIMGFLISQLVYINCLDVFGYSISIKKREKELIQ